MTTVASPVLIDTVLGHRGIAQHGRKLAVWRREIAVVGTFTLLTAAAAQVRVSLSFTPVPITGQTLAVLLAAASLGARRGAASQILYWLLGMLGLPFYAAGAGGWKAATGATMGYFIGFILAAGVVGRLAEYRHDRKVLSSLAAMALGTVIIYVCGAAWLSWSLNIPIATGNQNAIALGVTPFLLGDLVKMLLAALTTSASWNLVNRLRAE